MVSLSHGQHWQDQRYGLVLTRPRISDDSFNGINKLIMMISLPNGHTFCSSCMRVNPSQFAVSSESELHRVSNRDSKGAL